ncbi:ABC transporter permease, partial [Candidatus Bipolaricaulota bacterium]|nr:ABC transporter permease [Candidatus Bipolaricaulota bacterium]
MSRIARYVAQRLLLTIPMLFILLTIVFLLLRVMPGDPVSAMLGGRNISAEVLESYRVRLGFDRPVMVQYGEYLGGILRGDFGESLRTGKPVLEELFTRFPATIELAIWGMIVAILFGFTSGVLAATRADRPLDHGVRVFHITSFAMPLFWLGLMFQV